MEEGKTTLRRFGADGATLGDDLRVHIRSYALPPQMWIFGAIDFSAALAPFASQIGYEVTICDARDRFARSRRFSSSASVKIGWPQDVMADVELGPRDAVLVFTHDPKFDEPALDRRAEDQRRLHRRARLPSDDGRARGAPASARA